MPVQELFLPCVVVDNGEGDSVGDSGGDITVAVVVVVVVIVMVFSTVMVVLVVVRVVVVVGVKIVVVLVVVVQTERINYTLFQLNLILRFFSLACVLQCFGGFL